jgi:hypothetical protein
MLLLLLQSKYTSAEGLAMWGRSAGGLTVGATVNRRPELFKARTCLPVRCLPACLLACLLVSSRHCLLTTAALLTGTEHSDCLP